MRYGLTRCASGVLAGMRTQEILYSIQAIQEAKAAAENFTRHSWLFLETDLLCFLGFRRSSFKAFHSPSFHPLFKTSLYIRGKKYRL